MKRRGRGVEFDDDSEEDDDDDHARRIRRRMHKKRRIEGDSLDDLGQYARGFSLHTMANTVTTAKHEETLPFFNDYQMNLADDDLSELAHLQREDVDNDEDTEEPMEEISTNEVYKQVREAARKKAPKVCLIISLMAAMLSERLVPAIRYNKPARCIMG